MERGLIMPYLKSTWACMFTVVIVSLISETCRGKSIDVHRLSKRRAWNEPYFDRPGPPQPKKAIKDPNSFFSAQCKPFYMNNCMGACLSGYIVGPDGCPTCRCCVELVCQIDCPVEDVVLNEDGCQTCQCKVHQNTKVQKWIDRNRDRQGSYDAYMNNRPMARRPARPAMGGMGGRGGGGGMGGRGGGGVQKCAREYCPITCHWERDFSGCEVCKCKPGVSKKQFHHNIFDSAFMPNNKVRK